MIPVCAVRSHRAACSASELPRTVRLRGVRGVEPGTLRKAGAELVDGVWTIASDGPFDADVLRPWLPRSLGGPSAGGHLMQPPDGSAADLAASLCPVSWRLLSDVVAFRSGSCVECGDAPCGAAAPCWSWDDSSDVVHGTLESVLALCSVCRTCASPGSSSGRWPSSRRIARLALITRTDAGSVSESVRSHADRMSAWEGRPLHLDVSALSGLGLRFRRAWIREDDRVVSREGTARLVGVMLSDHRGMVEIV